MATLKSALAGTPAGVYPATLIDVEEAQNQFGQRLSWLFELDNGDTLKRTTSPFVDKPKTKAREIIAALLKRDLSQEELQAGFDTDILKGRRCHVVVKVEANQSGKVYSNIDSAIEGD